MAIQPLSTLDRTAATVRALTEDCLSMFSNCTNLGYYENQIALECMLAGLRLWADSVRAIAEETVSLDQVYKSRPDDLVIIKHILIMLSDELNDYETHAENEQAAGEFIHGIEAAMNNLSMMGLAIRQSWKASRHQREPLPYDPTEFDDLRQHLEFIILRRPSPNGIQSHVDSSKLSAVQRRLVDANLRRRHRFVLAQRASQALQHEPKLPPEQPPLSATTAPCPNDTQPSFSLYQPGDDGTQGTSNALDSELPVMEKAALQRRFCKCPCCCQTILCEEAKDLRTWRQHLFEDLSPYTCFIEECPTPWVLFTTSQEWEEHVNADHPWQWECPFCEDLDLVYSERSDIVDHFQDKHEDELRNYTLLTLLSWSKVQRMGVTSCPLCDFKGFEDSTDIIAHVLCHVYDFSLRALPWAKTGSRSLEKPAGKFFLPNDEDARARLLKWLDGVEVEPMEKPRPSVFDEPPSASPANEASSNDKICYFEYNDYFEQNSVDNSFRPQVASSIAISDNSEEGIGYEETFEGFDGQSAMLDVSQAKEIQAEKSHQVDGTISHVSTTNDSHRQHQQEISTAPSQSSSITDLNTRCYKVESCVETRGDDVAVTPRHIEDIASRKVSGPAEPSESGTSSYSTSSEVIAPPQDSDDTSMIRHSQRPMGLPGHDAPHIHRRSGPLRRLGKGTASCLSRLRKGWHTVTASHHPFAAGRPRIKFERHGAQASRR